MIDKRAVHKTQEVVERVKKGASRWRERDVADDLVRWR
jgi:hypothetical protein